jgi:hypothetical protein
MEYSCVLEVMKDRRGEARGLREKRVAEEEGRGELPHYTS